MRFEALDRANHDFNPAAEKKGTWLAPGSTIRDLPRSSVSSVPLKLSLICIRLGAVE